ncbi:hypothetical protein PUR61_10610 [Streptomyces sp. BE20]|uniref:tetratricopeptide repeat protein n=1 Tax=Streptomyces sp. BE20 TaxID=3002525 RepID=UPI002E77BAEB|nr:hypothetical protein [Streptomyces sp. BE20]MEE1822639.1 hypothetical protein [Streptomyces sp. BE20]
MTGRRIPNTRLRELLGESRWSGEELARAVNRAAAEAGTSLAYRRASVHQWLTGAAPRRPAAHFVCAALTRRLGRTVTLADAGFTGAGAEDPTEVSDQEALRSLAAAVAVPDRHGELLPYRPLTAEEYVSALVRPTRDGAPHHLSDHSPKAEPDTDPDVLRQVLTVFATVDRTQGGGQARTALAGLLGTTVAPMLGRPCGPVRHTRLLGDAARLSYLCAFMHVDDELNGLAGWYYRIGLALARRAGDTAAQAMVLRAMSTQAYELGRHRQSLRLARAAAACPIGAAPPRLRASVLGQLALAEAASGDGAASLRHLRDAHDLLPQIVGPPPPIGDYHRASWDHQRALVRAELGDPAGAIRSLETSAARRPRAEPRSRAVVLGRLAEWQLAAGHVEGACASWHAFLDVYPLLSSRRIHAARARLPRLLLPHRRRPAVDHLIQRATALRPS